MTQVSTNYRNYLQRIVDEGRVKTDRTGTGTISVFGYQMRWDLSKGFPLETLKFTAFRLVKEELLWFIRGDTNAQNLIDVNCHIWDEWMVPEDTYEEVALSLADRVELRAEMQGIGVTESRRRAEHDDYGAERLGLKPSSRYGGEPNGGEKVLDDEGIPRTKSVLSVRKGELGPVYGAQWRSWPNYKGGTIDQLAECIELLKTKPNSRRIIVSAWNPADLPDESKKPHVNAAEGRMALAACHTMFQFMTEPLSMFERMLIWHETKRPDLLKNLQDLPETSPEEYLQRCIDEMSEEARVDTVRRLDEEEIPTYRLSCQLYQRSCDSVLGVPFNIASYALLTQMVAQCVNMTPGDFVWTGGDCHIYLNHFETSSEVLAKKAPTYTGKTTADGKGVDTLLRREPVRYPTLWLNPDIKNIDDFQSDDIAIVDYEHRGKMSFPVAV